MTDKKDPLPHIDDLLLSNNQKDAGHSILELPNLDDLEDEYSLDSPCQDIDDFGPAFNTDREPCIEAAMDDIEDTDAVYHFTPSNTLPSKTPKTTNNRKCQAKQLVGGQDSFGHIFNQGTHDIFPSIHTTSDFLTQAIAHKISISLILLNPTVDYYDLTTWQSVFTKNSIKQVNHLLTSKGSQFIINRLLNEKNFCVDSGYLVMLNEDKIRQLKQQIIDFFTTIRLIDDTCPPLIFDNIEIETKVSPTVYTINKFGISEDNFISYSNLKIKLVACPPLVTSTSAAALTTNAFLSATITKHSGKGNIFNIPFNLFDIFTIERESL